MIPFSSLAPNLAETQQLHITLKSSVARHKFLITLWQVPGRVRAHTLAPERYRGMPHPPLNDPNVLLGKTRKIAQAQSWPEDKLPIALGMLLPTSTR